MKTLTLIFCAVATSTLFWISPTSEVSDHDTPKILQTKKVDQTLDGWGLDPKDKHYIAKFYRECEHRKEAAKGDFSDIYDYLCRELERTDISDEYRNALKCSKYNTAILMPGQPPIDALYQVAEKNWDNARALNGQAWTIAERGIQGEQVPEKLIAAAVYLAERTVEVSPEFGSAHDTLSHLYELQGRHSLATHAAEFAVNHAEGTQKLRCKKRLSELLETERFARKIENADNRTAIE